MTKVDEAARVPPIDEHRRRLLAAALDRDGVVAALLIGSQASGLSGPLSDVDLAVWLDSALDAGERWSLQLEVTGAATAALGTDEVDVVVLNDAPPLLQHRALRDGVRLLERDQAARVRLETRALLDYLDTAPLREAMAAGVKRRVRDGSFGRR